jgi:hypothetical protein
VTLLKKPTPHHEEAKRAKNLPFSRRESKCLAEELEMPNSILADLGALRAFAVKMTFLLGSRSCNPGLIPYVGG